MFRLRLLWGKRMQARVRLLSQSALIRIEALSDLDGDEAADVYAARRALLQDSDGRVRAEAARVLSTARAVSPTTWLTEALGDDLPSVREAAARSLGAYPTFAACEGRLRRLALLDAVWWVRRTAAFSLAKIAKQRAIPTLKEVLGDPFWRVRHAAVQALSVLWQSFPDEREHILEVESTMSEASQSAHMELVSRVMPELAAYKASAPPPANHAVANPDPAVTTARLRMMPLAQLTPADLVPFLSDAHAPLRELAVSRLLQLGRMDELEAVLPHMAIPGLPHALEAATKLLSLSIRRQPALVKRILGDIDAPVGAVVWACETVRQTNASRTPVLGGLFHKHPVCRLHAVRCLDELGETDATLFERMVEDEDSDVRSAALLALLTRLREPDLSRHLPELLGPDSRPMIRLLLLDRAAQHRDRVLLSRLADDPHPLVAARALRMLGQLRLLTSAETYAQDPQRQPQPQNDPLIREAVLPHVSVETLVRLLGSDPDPVVRRQALRQAFRRRGTLDAAQRKAIFLQAAASDDPWMRARGVSFASCERDLRTLLSLCRDAHKNVQRAAHDKLEEWDERGHAIAVLLRNGVLDATTHVAGCQELLKLALVQPNPNEALSEVAAFLDTAVFQKLPHEQLDPSDPSVRALRETIDVLRGKRPPVWSHDASEASPPSPKEKPPASGERRALGKTGLLVSPLAISGKNSLPPRAFSKALDAGVNLFFWEPPYETLSHFVRTERNRLHVVTGSYEADGPSLVRDVERALRTLKTDHLDVFLLFWARSPERFSEEALEQLAKLKQAGKIRATGFSTHDRALAEHALRLGRLDLVMTRHSAAHPGAEKTLFPLCEALGVGLLTFSATSYGRLLRPTGISKDVVRFSAADCYRYSLGQAGVSSVISAPRFPKELAENLAALSDPVLSDEKRAALRAHGEAVHTQSRRVNALLRKGHESPLHPPGEQATLAIRLAELLAEHPAPPYEPLGNVTARLSHVLGRSGGRD